MNNSGSSKKKEKYWFSQKRYGYGWGLPVNRAGWVVFVSYFVILAASTIWLIGLPEEEVSSKVGIYLGIIFVITAILALFARAHGPEPEWRWGDKKKNSKK